MVESSAGAAIGRRTRRRLGGIALLTALALSWSAIAAGSAPAQAPRAVYADVFTTMDPSTPAGRSFTADWVDPENPGGKPHGISRILVALHPGSHFDTTAVPRCEATDAQLMALGESACPPGSKLGVDELVGDTGLSGQARYVTLDSVFLNAPGEVIFLARERQSGYPHFAARGKVSGNTLDIPIPFIPGTPPEGTGLHQERGTWFNAVGAEGSGFFTTPPICPDEGEWTNRVTYTYGDGVVQTATSTTPCARSENQDQIRCRGEEATLAGSPDGDLIEGTPGPDVISGRGGRDRIYGGGGDDLICAGKGKDRANGATGDDRIHGGPGHDRLNGGEGDDRCLGGADRKRRC
jgi:RTX calcium-binding nonapeptide repeat (4 copies)